MILRFQLSYEDILALQKNILKNGEYHRKREKQLIIILTVIIGSLSMYFGSLFLTISLYYENPNLYNSLVILTGISSVLIFLPIIRKLYAPIVIWQYKSLTKKNSNKKWPVNMTLTLNKQGIEVNSNRNQVRKNFIVNWEAFHKVGEDEKRFYLYFDENDAIVIPKTWNNSTQDEQIELQKILKYYLNDLHWFN